MIWECLIRRKIAKFFYFFLKNFKCQMQKLTELKKKNLVSNDSELSISARNDIKKISAADGGTAAVFSVFRVGTFNSKN